MGWFPFVLITVFVSGLVGTTLLSLTVANVVLIPLVIGETGYPLELQLVAGTGLTALSLSVELAWLRHMQATELDLRQLINNNL